MSHQDWEPVILKKKVALSPLFSALFFFSLTRSFLRWQSAPKPKTTEQAVTQGARSGGGVALQTKHGAGGNKVGMSGVCPVSFGGRLGVLACGSCLEGSGYGEEKEKETRDSLLTEFETATNKQKGGPVVDARKLEDEDADVKLPTVSQDLKVQIQQARQAKG